MSGAKRSKRQVVVKKWKGNIRVRRVTGEGGGDDLPLCNNANHFFGKNYSEIVSDNYDCSHAYLVPGVLYI